MNAPASSFEDQPEHSAPAQELEQGESRSMVTRIVAFSGIMGTILFLGTWFMTSTWFQLTGFTDPAWRTLPMILILGFLPVTLLSFRWPHPVLRASYKVVAAALGFLNLGFAASLLSWAAWGLISLVGLPIASRSVAVFFFGAAVVATVYGLINAAFLQVTRVTVRLPKLPTNWQGRTIALVSDIHIGNIRGPRFVHRIVSRLRKLNPAAVLIAGDMFDGTKVDYPKSVQPWAALSAPAGVYFSTGNHDEFSDRRPALAALKDAGVRVLHNEKVTVDGLQIVGVHDGEAGETVLYRSILDRVALDPNQASILLTHQPSQLAIPEAAGIGLQVSGHTHGGQFWPWTWIIQRAHGRFSYGLNRFGKMQVLTSSGAGTWGPPLRIATKSEIVLIRLEAADAP